MPMLGQFLTLFPTADLIAVTGVVLAIFAYEKVVRDKYESLILLVKSLRTELEFHSDWFQGKQGRKPYSQDYCDVQYFNPCKLIHPVSFESAKELIRLGPNQLFGQDQQFEKDLIAFNERTDSFNSLLEIRKTLYASHYEVAQLLGNYLERSNFFKLSNRSELEKAIHKLNNPRQRRMFLLAQTLYDLNTAIHNRVIGTGNPKDKGEREKLCYLWNSVYKKTNQWLRRVEKTKPWISKYRGWVILNFILFYYCTRTLTAYLN